MAGEWADVGSREWRPETYTLKLMYEINQSAFWRSCILGQVKVGVGNEAAGDEKERAVQLVFSEWRHSRKSDTVQKSKAPPADLLCVVGLEGRGGREWGRLALRMCGGQRTA